MKKKEGNLIIGLDMDGVIVDNMANKIRVAKQLGVKLTKSDSQSDVIERVLSEETLNKLRKYLYADPKMALTADLIPGARKGLAAIKKSGIPYFLISRRQQPELAKKLLKKHGLWPTYFSEANAYFVTTREEKNQKAAELGVHIYIDDQPSVLEKLTYVKERFLFDRFDNFGDHPFVHKKVSNWKQFLSHLA